MASLKQIKEELANVELPKGEFKVVCRTGTYDGAIFTITPGDTLYVVTDSKGEVLRMIGELALKANIREGNYELV